MNQPKKEKLHPRKLRLIPQMGGLGKGGYGLNMAIFGMLNFLGGNNDELALNSTESLGQIG